MLTCFSSSNNPTATFFASNNAEEIYKVKMRLRYSKKYRFESHNEANGFEYNTARQQAGVTN